MPIAVSCQCGKTLNVKDELAGKAVKCPACQQVIRVPSATRAAATGNAVAAAVKPGGASARPLAPSPGKAPLPSPTAASPPASSSMDSLFDEAGFAVRTGTFCPNCAAMLQTGAVLCVKCGYHVETGATLSAHKSELEDVDSVESILKKADADMRRAKELDLKLQNAGMPAWMMAMILFVLGSCTAVAVIAVNVSRRSKDSEVSFNAVATMLLLGGIAFAALFIGSQSLVIYRAFKENPKQGMLVLLVPLYVFYYGFSRFKLVGRAFILCIVSLSCAIGLFVLAGMSNSGQL